jgi:hypothetical protein
VSGTGEPPQTTQEPQGAERDAPQDPQSGKSPLRHMSKRQIVKKNQFSVNFLNCIYYSQYLQFMYEKFMYENIYCR